MKKKLMLFSYAGGHINVQLKVAYKFKKEGFDIYILSIPATFNKLSQYNEEYNIINYTDISTSYDICQETLELIHNEDSDIPFEETKAYVTNNLSDMAKVFGEDKAGKIFTHFSRRAFLPIYKIQKLLKEIQPDIIGTTLSAARTERAAIIAANNLGIPSFAVEDVLGTAAALSLYENLYTDSDKTYNYLKELNLKVEITTEKFIKEKTFFIPNFHTNLEGSIGIKYDFFPNLIFCINGKVKENLMSRGAEEAKIFPIGHVAFDDLFQKTKNIKENKIVITTQPLKTKSVFLNLITPLIVDLIGDYQFIIKSHPSDKNIEELRLKDLIKKKTNKEIMVEKNIPVQELLLDSKMLITQTSTTAVEAFILNNKVITLNIGEDNFLSFEKAGIGKTLTNPTYDEMYTTVMKELNNSVKNKLDGLSDGNVLNRLYNIVNEELLD